MRSRRKGSRARARRRGARTSLIVVLDRSRAADADDRALLDETATRPRVVVASKCDLPAAWDAARCSARLRGVVADRRRASTLRAAIAGARAGARVARAIAPADREHAARRAARAGARRALARAAAAAAARRCRRNSSLADLHEARGRFDEITGARPRTMCCARSSSVLYRKVIMSLQMIRTRLRRHRHRRGTRRRRSRVGRGAHGARRRDLHAVDGHGRAHAVQSGDRRHGEGTPRSRDRRARRPDGARDRRDRHPVQAAEPQPRSGGVVAARAGGQARYSEWVRAALEREPNIDWIIGKAGTHLSSRTAA